MFTSYTDIANRAIQHLGQTAISALSDNTRAAVEINRCIDKVRQSELRNHLWRFSVRTQGLRPITSTTKLLTFPSWAVGTTYQKGDIVNDATANVGNSGRALYVSLVAANLANTPSSATSYVQTWAPYFGPETCDAYSASLTYCTGELAYTSTNYYMSCADGNINNTQASGAPWTAATLTSVTGATLFIPWPLTQVNSGVTRTAYRLPFNYMRVAPQDPKVAGGAMQTTGAGMQSSDFQFIGQYLLTSVTASPTVTGGPLLFRFGADIADVTAMEAQFCEALAARIAFDTCEPLTQNRALKAQIGARYDQIIGEARRDNMIEQGGTEPQEERLLLSRIPFNPGMATGQQQQQG